MKEAKYLRRNNQIMTIETGQIDNFSSINKAKQWSRNTQNKDDGNLGQGSVRVVDKFPKQD